MYTGVLLFASLMSIIDYHEVDVIEHNFVQHQNGDISVIQFLFREFSPVTCEYVTVGWALDDKCSRAGNYVDEDGKPYGLWIGRQGRKILVVKAYCLYATVTDYDPERWDMWMHPKQYRW